MEILQNGRLRREINSTMTHRSKSIWQASKAEAKSILNPHKKGGSRRITRIYTHQAKSESSHFNTYPPLQYKDKGICHKLPPPWIFFDDFNAKFGDPVIKNTFKKVTKRFHLCFFAAG